MWLFADIASDWFGITFKWDKQTSKENYKEIERAHRQWSDIQLKQTVFMFFEESTMINNMTDIMGFTY